MDQRYRPLGGAAFPARERAIRMAFVGGAHGDTKHVIRHSRWFPELGGLDPEERVVVWDIIEQAGNRYRTALLEGPSCCVVAAALLPRWNEFFQAMQ